MQTLQKIILDFKNFLELCSENLWVQGSGLEENFKIHVDKPENQLDTYLSHHYQETPLWFYFLSYDYTLFDYFQNRIPLHTDWDYTLLFNVDYIESSRYFQSIQHDIYSSKLTPFCPLNVFAHILQNCNQSTSSFKFSFPSVSFQKLSDSRLSDAFFKHAKINLNLASLSHIVENHYSTGMDIVQHIVQHDFFTNNFIFTLSESRPEDFFNLKINLLFYFPQFCPESFKKNLNPDELNQFIIQIISQKKSVDKHLLFQLMNKEHLILAITNQYFSAQELSSFVENKEILYHLLDYKLSNSSKKMEQSLFKKSKI